MVFLAPGAAGLASFLAAGAAPGLPAGLCSVQEIGAAAGASG